MTEKQEFQTKIIDLNSSGQGIGTLDKLKVFIDGALPSETVQAKLKSKKKNYAVGELLEILEPSQDRAEPICPIFDRCGGCQIMHLNYEGQLKYKQKRVQGAFNRIAKIEDIEVPLPLAANPLYYRNKIQLPFFEKDGKISLGLYEKHSNRVVEVEKCYIHSKLGQRVYDEIKAITQTSPLKVFDPETKKGFLRHLLIRSSENTEECLVVFITASGKHQETLRDIGKRLMNKCPEVKGVLQSINKKRYNSIIGDELITLIGQDHLYEEILGSRIKVSAHAFFQVNTRQAEELFKKAIEMADLKPDDVLLDAYCGIGVYSLLTAKRVKSVIGIECVESAVHDAKENAKLNKLSNTEFICAKVEDRLDVLKRVSAVILNPPRKGAEESLLKALVGAQIKKILYVSCDPATLSRDLLFLNENGYQIDEVQPVDLFPQTTHVETCVRLSLL